MLDCYAALTWNLSDCHWYDRLVSSPVWLVSPNIGGDTYMSKAFWINCNALLAHVTDGNSYSISKAANSHLHSRQIACYISCYSRRLWNSRMAYVSEGTSSIVANSETGNRKYASLTSIKSRSQKNVWFVSNQLALCRICSQNQYLIYCHAPWVLRTLCRFVDTNVFIDIVLFITCIVD